MNETETLVAMLQNKFEPDSPVYVTKAPGRVEVLGNHTDYNGGLVLAATINRHVRIAGFLSSSATIHSLQFHETVTFSPENLTPTKETNWDDYSRGIFWALKRRGYKISGVTAIIDSTVPIGAGLSSSAALEIGFVNLLAGLYGLELSPKSLAMIAFEAERLFCGVACGIMDQFTSQLCQQDSLLAIQCKTMQTENIPFSPDLSFIIFDSGVPRQASLALNKRKKECASAVSQLRESGWKIDTLGELRPNDLDALAEVLDDPILLRVTHIVNENERVRKAIVALRQNDFRFLGKIMYDSHSSSRDLYKVSHPRLDFLVELAQKRKEVLGARLTGAGFGGSVLYLTKTKNAFHLAQSIAHDYYADTGTFPDAIVTTVPGGVTGCFYNKSSDRI